MGLGTKAYLVGALLTFYSSFAAALGLGEITLNSALNQPLDAQIQLLHVRDLSEREIRVGLASSEDFERAGVDRSYFLTNLDFEVDLDAPAGPMVRVTSDEPVREPFINFLVSARWPSGRLLREYTLLVDLPVFSGEEAAPVQAATRQQPDTGRAAPRDTQPTGTPSTQPRASGEEYGPVGANENLWSIASRVRPDSSVTVQQTMLALQRLNPDAFINDNINLLRRGQVLRVPSKSDIQSLSPQQAVSEVANQNRRWNQRQTPEAEPSPQLEGSRTPTAKRTESSAPEGRVSLSSSATSAAQGEGSGAGEDGAGQIRNQLAVTQEELDAASRENADLKSRLGSVEEQIETLEKLVEVSSEELRSLELAAQQTNEVAGDETATPTDQPAEETAVQPEPAAEQQPVTTAQSSWLDLVMDNILYIIIGLGAVAVAIGLWLYMRNRDDGFDDEFDEDLDTDFEHDYQPAVAPGPIDEEHAVAVVPYDTESDEDLSAETEVINEAETEDVVGESDIHIAYGQYEQAEEKLTRALKQEPNNVAMRMKLLEVFAAQDDVANFDHHFAKLHTLQDQAAIDRAATLRAGISGAGAFDLAAHDSAPHGYAEGDAYESTDTQVPTFDSEASGDAADIADDTLQFDLNPSGGQQPEGEGYGLDDEGLTLDLDDEYVPQEEDATIVQDRFAAESDDDLSPELDEQQSFAPRADDMAVPFAAVSQDHEQESEQAFDHSLDAIDDSFETIEPQGTVAEPDVAVGSLEQDEQGGVLSDLEFDLDEINADLSFDDVELDLEFASFDRFAEEQEDDTRIAEAAKGFDLPENDAADLAVHADLDGDAEFRFDEELAPVDETANQADFGSTAEVEPPRAEGEEQAVEQTLEPTPAGSAVEETIPEDFDLELEGDLQPTDVSDTAASAEDFADEAEPELAGPSDFDDLELDDLGELDIDDEQIDGGEAAAFDLSDDEQLEMANNLAGEPLSGDPEEDDAEAIAQQLADAGPIGGEGPEANADEDFELEGDVDLDDLDRDLDSLTSDFDGDFSSTDALMDEPVTEFDEFDELDLDETPQQSSGAASVESEPSVGLEQEPSVAPDQQPAESVQEPQVEDHLASVQDDQDFTVDGLPEQANLEGYGSSADFEIPDFDPENDDDSNLDFLSDNDETATKLDLARAYIDMGDADGAKDILDEILDEGNDQQKEEAERLLGRLA